MIPVANQYITTLLGRRSAETKSVKARSITASHFLNCCLMGLFTLVLVACGGSSGSTPPNNDAGGAGGSSGGGGDAGGGGGVTIDQRLIGSWLSVEGDPSSKVMFTFNPDQTMLQHRAQQAIEGDRDDGDSNPMVAAGGTWTTVAATENQAPAHGLIQTTLNGQLFEDGSTTSYPPQQGIAMLYYFVDDVLWLDLTGLGILYVEMYLAGIADDDADDDADGGDAGGLDLRMVGIWAKSEDLEGEHPWVDQSNGGSIHEFLPDGTWRQRRTISSVANSTDSFIGGERIAYTGTWEQLPDESNGKLILATITGYIALLDSGEIRVFEELLGGYTYLYNFTDNGTLMMSFWIHIGDSTKVWSRVNEDMLYPLNGISAPQ